MLRSLRSKIDKNLAVLVSGTVVAQVAPLLSMPVLTRVYDAQSFGAYSVFTSILSVVAVVACLRFELSIPQIEHERSAIAVFKMSSVIVFVMATLLFLALTAGILDFHEHFNLDVSKNRWFLYFLTFGFLGVGLMQLCINRALRYADFSSIAICKIITATCYSTAQILIGVLDMQGG